MAKPENAKKALTKAEIVAQLAEKLEMTKMLVNSFFDELAKMAVENADPCFTIPGIGKLRKIDRAERIGKDPATGETKTYPAKTTVKFSVSSVCKKAILENK
jgi:DNA-binding protein HU-beta